MQFTAFIIPSLLKKQYFCMTVGARCVMVCCTVASQLDKYSHSFVYNSFYDD